MSITHDETSKPLDARTLAAKIAADLRATQKAKKTDTKFGVLGVDKFASEPTEYVTTGVTLLDWAITGRIDRPGYAVGRVIEIYGPESCGKSLLLFHTLGIAQKVGNLAGLTETERAPGEDFATEMGHVDPDSLIISYARSVETALDAISDSMTSVRKMTEKIVPAPVYLHGLDSWAGLCTKKELQLRMANSDAMAKRARQLKLWMTKEIDRISDSRTVLIAVNHEIANIGNTMNPTTSPGGGGWKFFASVRIRLNGMGKILTTDKAPLGIWTRAKIVKNRLGVPFRECEFPILFNHGIDDEWAIVNYLFKKGALGKTKGYAVWDGKSWRQRDLANHMRAEPDVRTALYAQAADIFGTTGSTAASDTAEEEEEGITDSF